MPPTLTRLLEAINKAEKLRLRHQYQVIHRADWGAVLSLAAKVREEMEHNADTEKNE